MWRAVAVATLITLSTSSDLGEDPQKLNPMSVDETTREKMIKILRESPQPLTAEDIVVVLDSEDLKPKDVYEHLKHIAKTVKGKRSELLVMVPPRCRSCGFTFKELNKPKKPSRCPKCKSERISPPAFKIVSRDQV
jgi:predicted Zn-ribbon and HTH transcriptional regulator